MLELCYMKKKSITLFNQGDTEMNIFCFTGNLGRDAEMRQTQSGTPICSFSVAVKSGYGDREKTDWVNCALFGKRAGKLAQYLTKGTQVAITGELTLNEYTNKDGLSKASLQVNVGDITLMGGGSRETNAKSPQNTTPSGTDSGDFDDEIPFQGN